jgi:hypothetical protein
MALEGAGGSRMHLYVKRQEEKQSTVSIYLQYVRLQEEHDVMKYCYSYTVIHYFLRFCACALNLFL